MTAAQQAQKAFEAALAERLRSRARLLLGADQAVVRLLNDARTSILAQLAAQPADWQQWQLSRIRDQLDVILNALASQAGASVQGSLRDAWQQGEDLVDKPLAAGGINIEIRLPLLDTQVLQAMSSFTVERMKNMAAEIAAQTTRQLGLVTIGSISPFQAIQAIQKWLGNDTPRRATTIVRTEVSRAFALASEQRLVQASEFVPGLQKQWRRSGKIHSRWNHDLMDGQVVDAKQSFKVPNPRGGFDQMRCPHDPAAPAEQIINCGCLAIPFIKDWQVMTAGAKPFTERELQLDARKAALDLAAKRAGRRQESAAGQ